MYEMSAAVSTAGSGFTAMYDWGLAVIHAMQSGGNPAITLIARAFTLLGEPIAYLAILPAIFWCVDERRGFKLGLVVFLSNGLNLALKESFRVPRPFVRDPSVGMIAETGFSTPSAHSQNLAAFWPSLMGTSPRERKFPRAIRVAVSIALPLCIGLSRVYLGVHYPTDVVFGWAIGALIASLTVFVVPTVAKAISTYGPTAAILASLTEYERTSGRSLRTLKLAGAAFVSFVLNAINRGDSSMGGAVFGFAAGYILLTDSAPGRNASGTKKRRFSASEGSIPIKAIRLALGFAVAATLYFGLKKLLPDAGSEYYALCRFFRYGVTGFWATWGAPRLFQRLSLA